MIRKSIDLFTILCELLSSLNCSDNSTHRGHSLNSCTFDNNFHAIIFILIRTTTTATTNKTFTHRYPKHQMENVSRDTQIKILGRAPVWRTKARGNQQQQEMQEQSLSHFSLYFLFSLCGWPLALFTGITSCCGRCFDGGHQLKKVADS